MYMICQYISYICITLGNRSVCHSERSEESFDFAQDKSLSHEAETLLRSG